MPSPLSQFRQYFRFKSREKPLESNLNAGLIDKIDQDMHAVLTGVDSAQGDLATLTQRVDAHSNEIGELTTPGPEFESFALAPTFVSTTQFYVTGNLTNELTVNRAVRATLTGSTPVSQIQTSAYDGGTNRTNITLYDAILNNTLSAVELGFIHLSLPRVGISNLGFDPATETELTAHKASGDHDARHPRINPPAEFQAIVGTYRFTGAGGREVQIEDTSIEATLYRILALAQVGQAATLRLYRGDGALSKAFITLDGSGNLIHVGFPFNMNGLSIKSLGAPVDANDGVRKTDLDTAVSTLTIQHIDPAVLKVNNTNVTGNIGFTAVDISSDTTGTAKTAIIQVTVSNGHATEHITVKLRKNGSSSTANIPAIIANPQLTLSQVLLVPLSAGEVFDYNVTYAGATVSVLTIELLGYIR